MLNISLLTTFVYFQTQSQLRLIRVQLALGNVKEAEKAIAQYGSQYTGQREIDQEKSKLLELKHLLVNLESATARNDQRHISYACDKVLEMAIGDINIKVRKAFALIKLGRHNEAGEIAA